MKGRGLLLYVQVGIAEKTSVAICFAIRAAVGHIFHGAESGNFFEALAILLHMEDRHESLPESKQWFPPA